MQIFRDLRPFQPKESLPLILILGNFDGVHVGHQALLRYGIERAREEKGRAAVLTFPEHPQQVLHPKRKVPLLTSIEHRLFLLESLGLDLCFLLHFTKAFSELSAEAFVKEVLVDKLRVKEVCLGHNARFGHGREGDIQFMRKLARQFGFLFEEMPGVKLGAQLISSSRVRHLVAAGRLDEVIACLGRPYSILENVVHGDGRGRTLGYPTANLAGLDQTLLPEGVYAVTVRVVEFAEKSSKLKGMSEFKTKKTGPWFHGVLNYGKRPTFKQSESKPVAEVFILDFKGNLYGKTLEVAFLARLRGEKAFESADALKHQIKQDILDSQSLFSGAKEMNY